MNRTFTGLPNIQNPMKFCFSKINGDLCPRPILSSVSDGATFPVRYRQHHILAQARRIERCDCFRPKGDSVGQDLGFIIFIQLCPTLKRLATYCLRSRSDIPVFSSWPSPISGRPHISSMNVPFLSGISSRWKPASSSGKSGTNSGSRTASAAMPFSKSSDTLTNPRTYKPARP